MTGDTTRAKAGFARAAQRVGKILNKHASFVLSTHRDPDGDGLGAEAALAEAIRRMGKKVTVVNNDPVPARYQFMPETEAFETFDSDRHLGLATGAEVAVLLDAAEPARAGSVAGLLSGFKGVTVVIDHHPVDGWAELNLIDPRAESTTLVLLRLLDGMALELSPTMAEALYTGLVTDTQSFSTPSTTPEAHEAAARLLVAGVDVGRVDRSLDSDWHLGRQRLLGDVLAGLRTAADGQVAWRYVAEGEMSRRGAGPADLQGFINQALRTAGVEVAVMLVEQPDGSVGVSLRARPGATVDGLARALGGGGHRLAAGARITRQRAAAMVEMLGLSGEAADAAQDG